MMSRSGWAAATLATALVLTSPASAHEVLHTVERGRALAVKALFADGEPLAYAEYVVFSPADARIPYQKGRTDRGGYVAFVPDVPGAWHVRVTDASGHGVDLDASVALPLEACEPSSSGIRSWAFALRPILGVSVLAVLFGALVLLYRKRRSRP